MLCERINCVIRLKHIGQSISKLVRNDFIKTIFIEKKLI